MGFITIDFETSCGSMDSACSIGLVKVQDDTILEERQYYIQPPTLDFSKYNVDVHGITPEMVSDKPMFPEVWDEIKDLFYENIVIAHNASFDMSVLRALQAKYKFSMPNFLYACSIDISSTICPDVGGSLPDRASYFGIDGLNHHDALSDAKVCAEIVLSTMRTEGHSSLGSFLSNYPDLKIKNIYDLSVPKAPSTSKRKFLKYGGAISPKDVIVNEDKNDPTHIFYDKHIVVTGEFSKLNRREMFQTIADIGGILKTGVSRNTDIVIVGKQDKSIVGEDGLSNKEEKAYELIEKGYDIRFVCENELYEILGI